MVGFAIKSVNDQFQKDRKDPQTGSDMFIVLILTSSWLQQSSS